MSGTKQTASTRREFIQKGATAGGALAAAAAIMPRAFAAGDDVIRVGWVGCGGRGAGAMVNALTADKNVKLVAMGDAFKDKLEASLAELRKKEKFKDLIDVPPEKQFVGFDAYKQVIDSGVDVVILTTPPHFRPLHLAYAVEKGKHTFSEKPVAVDATGVRSVLASCAEARKKKLSVVSGLCWRYDTGTAEFTKYLHDGGIGEIQTVQTNFCGQGLWSRPRQDQWSDMEFQLRNWLYYTWLSGDFIVEQDIHNLDRIAWAMKSYPVSAYSLGGRQTRTDAVYGNIFDHIATVYEFANGSKCFNYCRQQPGTAASNGDWYYGTKGRAEWTSQGDKVTGEKPATFNNYLGKAYQLEHDQLFASIRKGEPINDGEYMAHSTLMAIMGREAAYTGQLIKWDDVLHSPQDLTPAKYAWDKLEFPKVPMPGFTKFEMKKKS